MTTHHDPRVPTPGDPDAAALAALGQIALGALGSLGSLEASGGEPSYGALKRGLREAARRDPLDALGAVVLGGSWLFYLAEKDRNPKVGSFWDALVFVTTSLSVGYDDVFARTDAGKAIASFVMTFGPALSASALDPPAREAAAADAEALAVQRAILARLDSIHAALEAQRAATTAAPGSSP